MKSGLLIAHGSRSSKAHQEVAKLAGELKDKTALPIFEYAFLDVDEPRIPQGIQLCVKQGATHILVLLHFLNSGNHVLKDVPSILASEKKKYPHVDIETTSFIGSQPELTRAYQTLIEKSLKTSKGPS